MQKDPTGKRYDIFQQGRLTPAQRKAKEKARNAGTSNPRAKLTEDEVRHIRTLFKSGIKIVAIAKLYNRIVSTKSVRDICLGNTWQHLL